MRRAIITIIAAASLLAVAAPAQAATLYGAKRAVKREVRVEYLPESITVYCTRLDRVRFRCRWFATDPAYGTNGLGCSDAWGKARARKYRYSWDVRLYD